MIYIGTYIALLFGSLFELILNKRAIKTVSSAQVRKSIYNSSVDSYKHYEKFLTTLYSGMY